MDANCTFNFQNVYCPAKLNVEGTLNASGNTYFTAENKIASTGELKVLDGRTKMNTGENGGGICGTLTIESGAVFENARAGDGLNYSGSPTVNVYGTLDMASTRWTLGGATLKFYAGSTITGNGQGSYGALDTNNSSNPFYILAKDGQGTVNLSARLRPRAQQTFNIAEGVIVNCTGTVGDYKKQINITGSGTFKIATGANFPNNVPFNIASSATLELAGGTIAGAIQGTGNLSVASGTYEPSFSSFSGAVSVSGSGTVLTLTPTQVAAVSGITVGSGSTLKIKVTADEILHGYDASSKVSNSGGTVMFVDSSGTEITENVSGDGETLDPAAKIWRDGTWAEAVASGDDATLYISQNSTLNVSEALSLGIVTVVKESAGNVTLTISGVGALTTGGWTIPAGVTVVTADGMEIAGDVTGGGIINVPANTTLTMDGVTTSGDTLADRVKVAVSGTLKTKGTTTLSAANTSAAGSLIEVVSGSTTLATEYKGIFGDITIGSAENGSAQLTMGASYRDGNNQGWDWLGQSSETCIDIYGTLTLGDSNLILYAGNSIKLHNGAIIEGSSSGTYASSYGSLAFLGNAPVQVDANATATINAHINSRTGFSPEFTIGENATLMVSQTFIGQTGTQHTGYYCGGSITKAGLGTLSLTGFAMTKPMTINAGKVVVDTAPTASSFAIAEGATFTLNANLDSDVGESQYTGAGTLELENLSGDKWYLQNINFSGIIKTKNAGGNYWIGGADSNGGLAPLFSGTPELIAESGTQLINRNFNADTLPIRDLSGGATITVGNYDSEDDANKTRTVSSKQTKNTTFSGVFASQGTCSTSLEVYGNTSAANLYALTLSGVNTTAGGLTVRDNAKVAFASSGSWANGTVSVNGGGWIESTNTSAMTTLSLADGAGIVVPYVASAAVPLTATTITLPASGTINVDLSAVDVAANETVTILSATTLNNPDASLFMQTSGNWRFAVEGNTVTATKLGALTWDYTNGWSTDDFSGYTEATINVTGTQMMTLDVSPSIENLTINGISTPKLTITSSSGNAISAQNVTLGSGVIVFLNGAALNVTGGTITGGSEIDVNKGATLTLENVDCESRLNVHGTVVTKGKVDLSVNSVAHVFQTDGTLSVESGATTYLTNRTGNANGFSGVMDIKSGGRLITKTTNALAYARDTVVVNVHGTLEFNSGVSWQVGSINTINLYDGGQIIGTQTDIGNLDLRGAKVYAKGNATIDANVRAYDGTTATISVDADKTLTIKKVFATDNSTGTITKEGEGTLKLEDANCSSAGQTTEPTIAGSEGTVEFYASTDHRYLNKSSTFSGNVKFTQDGSDSKELVVQNTELFSNSNRPALEVSGGFTMHNTLSAANVALQVRDLSGSGTVSPKFGDGTVARIVDTQQTTDTTFNGTFIHDVNKSNNDRNTGLKVTSVDTQVHKLTLTGDNDTTGPLTISSYGKVLFSGSGCWTNGTITVGANGYLESSSSAETLASTLTLQDGATMTFVPNKMVTVTTLNLPSGEGETVTFDINYVPALDGTTLISSASIKANTDVGMIECENAIIKAEEGAIKAYPVATVTTFGSDAVVAYSSVQEAINNARAENGQYVTAYQSETVTATGQILLKIADGAVVTLNSSKAGYAYDVGASIEDGIYMFSDNVQVAATFKWNTAVASGSWSDTGNWTSDDGTVSRIPGSLDTVIFESDATVETPASGFGLSFAALQANASVTIKRDSVAIDDRLTRTVYAYGAISGTGSLTLNDGVNLANASGASLSIGVPVTVAGATALTVAEGVAASFTGSGTLTLDAITSTPIVGDGWTGTVWFKNMNGIQIEPAKYGNVNSKLKFTGVTATIASGTTFYPEVVLEDDGDTKAFTIDCTTAYSDNTIQFSKLSGSGTLVTSSSNDKYPRTNFRINKWSDFVGSLDVDRGRAVFGTDTISNDDWRYIYISEDADVTIAAGKSFTADQGLRVYGELTVESNNALSSKAVQGSGTIIYEVAPNNGTTKPSFHATLWTGVVEFQAFAAAGIKLAEYGTSNSKIKINGITSGHLMWEDQNVQAEVVLAGDVNITATSHRNYTYAHISGTGSFSVSNSNTSDADPKCLTITKLDVASGSVGMAVTNNTTTTLTINKLVLPAIPACDAKVLAVGGTGVISLDVGNVKFGEESLPAKYKLERRHVGEEGDGFYVYYNGTIFSVW